MATSHTLAWYFEQWKERHEQDDSQLAGYLGVPAVTLASLAAERVPRSRGGVGFRGIDEGFPESSDLDMVVLRSIAERHGANLDRLEDVGYLIFKDPED